VKLREMAVDDRLSWGFSRAVVPWGIGRTTHARTALRFLGRRSVIGWTGRQGVRVGGER
jgi:hypothetical protein